MTETEFVAFPKIPRFNREVIITEKIDGTNACVVVPENPIDPVLAQSRTRFITPDNDNYGFAAWVCEHAEELRRLGPGRHFGEWYGRGINRNYGLESRHFALFNVSRWNAGVWLKNELCRIGREFKRTGQPVVKNSWAPPPNCCQVVPVLAELPKPDTGEIYLAINMLKLYGSRMVEGFRDPEGIVVYHVAGGHPYKITIENDERNKGL